MQRIATALVWCGLIVLCAGVWVLAGYGWALVTFGAFVGFVGLVGVDVDKHGGGKGT